MEKKISQTLTTADKFPVWVTIYMLSQRGNVSTVFSFTQLGNSHNKAVFFFFTDQVYQGRLKLEELKHSKDSAYLSKHIIKYISPTIFELDKKKKKYSYLKGLLLMLVKINCIHFINL